MFPIDTYIYYVQCLTVSMCPTPGMFAMMQWAIQQIYIDKDLVVSCEFCSTYTAVVVQNLTDYVI